MMRFRCSAFVRLLVLMLPVPLLAAPFVAEDLAARMPERTLFVLAWSGWDHSADALRQTAIGKALSEPQVKEFFQGLEAHFTALIDQNVENRSALELVRQVATLVLHSPGAFVVFVDDSNQENPIAAALVLEAAQYKNDVTSIEKVISNLVPEMRPTEMSGLVDARFVPESDLTWGWLGDSLVIGVGGLSPVLHSLQTGEHSLGQSEAYRRRAGAVPGSNTVLFGYADVGVVADLVRQAAGDAGAKDLEMPRRVLGVLGLEETQAAMIRMGVDGAEMFVNAAVHFNGQPAGLFKCLEGAAGPDRMRIVPGDIMSAGALAFDVNHLLRTIVAAIEVADPPTAVKVEAGSQNLENMLGVKLRQDLLENLTGHYTFYVKSEAFFPGLSSLALLCDLNDATAVERAFNQIEQFLGQTFLVGSIHTSEQTVGANKATLHVWNSPVYGIRLGWAVFSGRLILELTPTSPGVALGHMMSPGSSLADEPVFQAAAAHLKDTAFFYNFSNDKKKLAAQLTTGYAILATLESIMLPSFHRARELSKRLVSAGRLRQIGQACHAYVSEHDGRYPPTLQVLVDSGNVSRELLANPRVSKHSADDQYVYVPGHTRESNDELVLAFADPTYVQEGINILRVNGEVQFVKGEDALRLVGHTFEQMGLPPKPWTYADAPAAMDPIPGLPPAPPLAPITKHFSTTLSQAYMEGGMLHANSKGTLPVEGPATLVAANAMAVSILLPSLSRARELSKRVVSAASLRDIGYACRMYAEEHDGRYPPSLMTLVETEYLAPKSLVSPRADRSAQNHYIYIPGHDHDSNGYHVVAFANPVYVREGINLLYVDGSVQFVKGDAALQQVRESYIARGLEAPELSYAATEDDWTGKLNPVSTGSPAP